MLIQSPGSAKDNFRGFSKEELNTTNEKMEQQQQHLMHIKRLLSTAATATGIVGDLDAPMSATLSTSSSSASRKAERNLWRLEEIKEMLAIMQETNALDLLNDKMVKSESVFYDIEKMMKRRGYTKKTHNQIWTKWKFLKSTYMTSRRNSVIPKMIPTEIYFILHKMLGNGSDLVYSLEDSSNAPSLDGEHSMADEDIDSSPHTNTNGQQGKSSAVNALSEKPEAFGMAHPIFGFRLGMVKSEPADTGYETTANNSVISENDSMENSAIYPVGLSPQNSQDNSTSLQCAIKPDLDERVTDSPETLTELPTREHSSSPGENSLLMPRETASMSIRPLAVKQKVTPTRASPMPNTLRIAPFAKEANITDTTSTSQELPAPTTLRKSNSTKYTTDVVSSKAGTLISVPSALTIPDSRLQGSIVRLPKDVTLKLRTNSVYNKMIPYQTKQIPMQKLPSPYTLRTEERYGQNRSQITPPLLLNNKHQQQQQQLQQEQPMTSHMAKLRANLLNKKRRLDIPHWDANDAATPTKVPRYANPPTMPNNLHMRNNSYNRPINPAAAEDNDNNDAADYDDGDDDDGDDDEDYNYGNPYSQTSYQRSRAYEQQYAPAPAPIPTKPKFTPPKVTAIPQVPQPTPSSKDSKKRTPMEEILKDMAMSLRQSQLQMVNDFFEQQMELARKEHEFQMEQDRLMMAAFKKQTQHLMKAAQELFGLNGSGNSAMMMNATKNKNATTNNNKKSKNVEHHKIANTRVNQNEIPSQQYELSSSDSDEPQENGESDPLLSAFDPTQFVSSELVETNDENDDDDDDESLV